MNSKGMLYFTGLLLLALLVTGCTRSASKAPAGTDVTPKAAPTEAGGTQPDMMGTLLAQGQMTQTAIAGQQGGGGGAEPTATPQPQPTKPPQPTPTPVPTRVGGRPEAPTST
ncbi:MAG: hypothetical protein D6819_06695, partial [Gammaproteobacteria bacterium]